MKWDISFTRESTSMPSWYTQDSELNYNGDAIEAPSEDSAILFFKAAVAELMCCNALSVEVTADGLNVFEPSDHEFIEGYSIISASRCYTLIDSKGNAYLSHNPGTLGGHRKLKIYGMLDCPSALRHISKGKYVQHRVFFRDEQTAIAAGYRPCAVCMKNAYKEWKSCPQEILP